jgi:hypothetical protein
MRKVNRPFSHPTNLSGRRRTNISEESWLLVQVPFKLDRQENLIIQVARVSMF